MYSSIVWDWNGTLLADLFVCFATVNGLLSRHGYEKLTPARYHEIFGFPIEDYYARAGFDFARDPYPELAAEYMREYVPASDACGLAAGALCALRYFRAKGIRQYVLTVSDTETLARQMDRLGVRDYFDAVIGQDNYLAHGKLALAKNFMAAHGLSPEGLLLIGDTLHDAEIARALSCDCVLIARGHQSAERLRASGFPVYSSLFAFLRHLAGAPAGCVFDLDGTVLDTLSDLTRAVNATRAEFGLPAVTRETVRRTVGHGARALMEVMVPGHTEEALAAYRRIYDAGLIVETAPYPGLPELLASLRRLGLPAALNSNKPDGQSVRLVDHFYPGQFVYAAGKRDGVPAKPDPAGALAAAEAMGLPPARLAYIGDSDVDLQTARAAGMLPLTVTWGFRDADALADAGGLLFFDAPAELAAFLGDESALPDPFFEA